MKKIRLLLLILLTVFVVNVQAEEKCNSQEYARLKELAKKVEFDYSYVIKNDVIDFTITATNLNKELKVLIIENYYAGNYKQFKGDNTGSLSGFGSGERVVITIKGFVPNACSGETVLTRTIKLPYYNRFYNWVDCEGNEDFKYCKEIIDSNITENEYKRQFNIYLKAKEEKVVVTPSEETPVKNNTKLYIIIGGAIFVVVIVTALIIGLIKKRKKYEL